MSPRSDDSIDPDTDLKHENWKPRIISREWFGEAIWNNTPSFSKMEMWKAMLTSRMWEDWHQSKAGVGCPSAGIFDAGYTRDHQFVKLRMTQQRCSVKIHNYIKDFASLSFFHFCTSIFHSEKSRPLFSQLSSPAPHGHSQPVSCLFSQPTLLRHRLHGTIERTTVPFHFLSLKRTHYLPLNTTPFAALTQAQFSPIH